MHRQQLFAKGIELEPGAFDQDDDDDETSSDATSTSAAKILFRSGKKNFLKKTAPENKVPELQHLDSETNDSERDRKKGKHKKNTRPASGMQDDQFVMKNSSFCA